MHKRFSQLGQAAVETALVLPLNIFLILGIIQYGLITQARIMAKYAAYRAVRVGVMNNADPDKMKDAALLTLLPVLALPKNNPVGAGQENFPDVKGQFMQSLIMAKIANSVWGYVDVVICGPLDNDLANVKQSAMAGGGSYGSADQVDFDDPRVSQESRYSQGVSDKTSFDAYMRTKLRIQVQFKYRMAIPFANWVIEKCYLGMAMTEPLPDVLRMGSTGFKFPSGAGKVMLLAAMKIYTVPINVSYAMRMQSDFYTKKFRLPNQNKCVHY